MSPAKAAHPAGPGGKSDLQQPAAGGAPSARTASPSPPQRRPLAGWPESSACHHAGRGRHGEAHTLAPAPSRRPPVRAFAQRKYGEWLSRSGASRPCAPVARLAARFEARRLGRALGPIAATSCLALPPPCSWTGRGACYRARGRAPPQRQPRGPPRSRGRNRRSGPAALLRARREAWVQQARACPTNGVA